MANRQNTGRKKINSNKGKSRDTQKSKRGKGFKWPVSEGSITGFIVGCVLVFLALYGFLACCSFFFTGGMDQSLVIDRGLAQPTEVESAHNICSTMGARLSHWLINDQFGLGSFFLLFLLLSIGAKLIGFDKIENSRFKINLVSRIIFSSVMCVYISLLMGWITNRFLGDGFILWGGAHGSLWAGKLDGYIGVPGMLLLLSSLAIVISVFYSTENIRRYRSLAKLGNKKTSPVGSIEETELPIEDLFGAGENQKKESLETDFTELDSSHYSGEVDKLKGISTIEESSIQSASPQMAPIPEKMQIDGVEIEIAKGEEPCDLSDIEAEQEKAGRWMHLRSYTIPSVELLNEPEDSAPQYDQKEIEYNKERIISTLDSFKIKVSMAKVTVGPTITLYEVIPEPGIKISRIRSMEDDIAMSLKSEGIRIIAPMPGKGTIGIEVPNSQPRTVPMRSVLASKKYQESKFELPIAIGKTITNEVFMFDLTKMPHLLIAGATGQGKSVGLNAMIASLLFKKRPEELKFVLVDPKMLEFSLYEGIERHFLAKLPDAEHAIVTDMSMVVPTLKSLCVLMDERYKLLTRARVRNIKEYNELFKAKKLSPLQGHEFMSYIVLIIDEFADLIMTAGKEVEMPITRIAQKARAAGIHMVIATQRPTTDIITGVIKANFPARIAFKVFSAVDSRTILDQNGANQLVGRGDMLFNQGKETIRLQCAFMDTPESEQLVEKISMQESFGSAYLLPEAPVEKEERVVSGSHQELDPMFAEVARMVVSTQLGSTSNIQRRFNIGYNRAGRLMDQLEAMGIVSAQDGSKPRQVLIQDEMRLEAILGNADEE
ncbi:cell division protein FtsK [Porphyromonas crevioricanis]|uniref:DNA translocase FtsK n=1 Tax=Porphyromonas crevioricanis TaxID=393921 RepID=UPI00052DCBBC|nr:DNA translocase FtsK [Porphyromonas crevioricanis]KGN88832.1 cell division protein FtsK [Porphyromonas crevioricanis]